MLLPPYSLDELSFAFRCYVYFRWHTYRCRSIAALKQLAASQIEEIHPEVRILEFTPSDTDVALLASLLPTESVSTAVGKLKGATSKVLRKLQGLNEPERTLGAGYFAATTGDNNSEQLDRYLENQEKHHGYDRWAQPPVWIQNWDLTEKELESLQTKHAIVSLRWHIVLSTWNRVGVFTLDAARKLCEQWATEALAWQVRFQKITVVPDHVHTAVMLHPTVRPAELVVKMMNSSQEMMRDRYPQLLIKAGQPRLWKLGAYVGSFGDITKAHIRNYLRRWEQEERGPRRDNLKR